MHAYAVIASARPTLEAAPHDESRAAALAATEGAGGELQHFTRVLPSTQYGLATMRSNSNVDDSDVLREQRRLSQSVENVLCAYLNRLHHHPDQAHGGAPSGDAEALGEYPWARQASGPYAPTCYAFHPSLVYLCAPFVQCIQAEAGMYFTFERLMSMLGAWRALTAEAHNEENPLSQRVASFMTLFRTKLPELHAYFEAEEVDVLSVATSWLQHLLAREMQMDDLMRLWGTSRGSPADTYFAVPDLLDLHLYVCLAILTYCKDALEDLDRSEIMSMLSTLPPLDVDRVRGLLTQIISDAVNIKLSLEQDDMYE